MDIGAAIEGVKRGGRWTRMAWVRSAVDGPTEFVFLIPGTVIRLTKALVHFVWVDVFGEGAEIQYPAQIFVIRDNGTISVYGASVDDLLADDWREFQPLRAR